jgi:hypothetical protein
VLALGAGVGSPASPRPTPPHAEPDARPADRPLGDRSPGGGGRHGGGFPGRRSAHELAGKLGVTEEQLSEALRAIREENRSTTPRRPDPGAARRGPGQGARRDADLDEAKVTQALAEIRAAQQAEQAAALKERLDAAVATGS